MKQRKIVVQLSNILEKLLIDVSQQEEKLACKFGITKSEERITG